VANQNGRPIAPARKLVALVLGTLAVFVAVFGAGLTSWAIVVLGLAMLALSIALGMVNVVRRGARAWVSGTAQVKAVSDPPVSSAYGRAELQIVVVAPGLPVTEVLVRDPRVPVDKWPRLGETLPVTVDVDDMRRVRIDWLNAPDRADPPPPGRPYDDEDAYTDSLDEYDDDLLGDPEPPPWATRDQSWGLGPDEPPPPPPPAGASAEPDDLREGPVVVHDTPGGPVVEGQWVGHDVPGPLPKRAARSGPIPAPAGPSEPESRPAGARPSPRPRAGAATATVEEDAAPSGSFGFSGTDGASPDAPAGPADHPVTPSQWSRPEPPADDAPPAAAPADLDLDAPAPAPAPTPAPAPVPADADDDEEPPAAAAPRPRPAADDEPAGPAAATPRPRPAADDQVMTGAATPAVDDPPPAAPDPAPAAHETEIDLPLDGDPEPPPETTPAAQAAVRNDLIGPPPHEPSRPEQSRPEPSRPEPSRPEPSRPEPSRPEPVAEAASAPRAPEPLPDDPPVISGVDTPPAPLVDSTGAPPPIANGHSFARKSAETADSADSAETAKSADSADSADSAANESQGAEETDEPRGPWSDLEGGYEPEDRIDEVITAYPSARPGPAGAIHGVGVTVLVTNLARSIAFYRDMLGFFEIDSGHGSAVLASGDTRLVLRSVHDLSAEAGRLVYLNLEVGDVEAVYGELKAKGVTFVHAPRAVNRGDKLELWSATFTDPDKHNIAISQWRAIN
jgi:catechol 2,3-dioxygenase-like lactoylglutathione lyase family enzyme